MTTVNTNTNTTATGMDTVDSTMDTTVDSKQTKASRNEDRSRGDHVVDWTNDGPGKHNRDWSTHHTNDKSKHDTGA